MPQRARSIFFRLILVPVAAVSLPACGMIKGMAINSVATTLSTGSGDTFTRDDDPELIRDASAFALKLYESLLESVPKNQELLIATCSAFTQYGYGFVQTDALELGDAHHDEVVALNERALKLYVRAKNYCMRAMELRYPGIGKALMMDAEGALKKTKAKDVEMLYWTAASWGAAISLGVDKPELVIDLPTVRALAERALALDEKWSNGAIHEMLITLDLLPEAIGGSPARAREHFAKATAVQQSKSPGPFVAMAAGAQNREEFTKLLDQALAINPDDDPNHRLVTLITQRRARALKTQIDTRFPK